MTLVSRFWHVVLRIASWMTFNSVSDWDLQSPQHPLGNPLTPEELHNANLDDQCPPWKPPALDPDDDEFTCDYSHMKDWCPCSIPENRECWLRNRKTGEEFNIHTNYEDFQPVGITRRYTLEITESWINADGKNFTAAKVFNGSYPGPLIQACWGDKIEVRVINKMKSNGTSIHWHGLRQHNTNPMDGVNGVTQCPIPPGEEFTYVIDTKQYGTSWYHSHYSVQYADGLAGPLTIHGPVSAPFDIPKKPLLMTDWSHESAYRLLYNRTIGDKTILLNGHGNATHFGYETELDVPGEHVLYFKETPTDRPRRPKRYLLRLINTSFDSTFVFSIDNHWVQVVTSDFVPIEPYWNTSILIGIGQRYEVIVEARPQENDQNHLPDDGNYWIRTWVADNCGVAPRQGAPIEPYEQTGILRYNWSSTARPTSSPWLNISKACSDETYTSLRPKIPWYVGPAANAIDYANPGQKFDVEFNPKSQIKDYPMAKFAFRKPGDPPGSFKPLKIDYNNPTILHLAGDVHKYPEEWVVIPEDYTAKDWVYLVLTMNGTGSVTGAHPIHLHGHDFAILEQAEHRNYDPTKLNLKLDNPPRRDVVLLPQNGYVVIAFKADNPGVWLMHCHIALHASEGLAIQIMERQSDANAMWPRRGRVWWDTLRACNKWVSWRQDMGDKFWDGDSGI